MAENNSSAPIKNAEGDDLAIDIAEHTAEADAICRKLYNQYGHEQTAKNAREWIQIAKQLLAEAPQAVAAQAPAAVAVPEGAREAFEAWAPTQHMRTERWAVNPTLYDDENAISAWQGWEAGVAWARATPALPATEDSSAGDLAEVQAEPTDAEIIDLNDGERYFSMSESRFGKDVNPHTQYHTGEPGYLQFARAVLARWGAAPQAQPADALDRIDAERLRALGIAAGNEDKVFERAMNTFREPNEGESSLDYLRAVVDNAMAAAQEGGKQ